MLSEIILVRHGEADHMIKNLTGGWSNVHLTPKGRIQAQKTAKFLYSTLAADFITLYSSDLPRALETSNIINSDLDKTLKIIKELRELSNGDAKNLTQEEAKEIYLSPTEPLLDWIPYPNGESWRMLYNRISQFMEDVNQKDEARIIIVSHGNAICAIIHWWLKLDFEKINHISYDIDPCSISRLRINNWGDKTISYLNQTLHLRN